MHHENGFGSIKLRVAASAIIAASECRTKKRQIAFDLDYLKVTKLIKAYLYNPTS